MRRYIKRIESALICTLMLLSAQIASTQTVVEVNLDVKLKLGDVETFDRSKFITIHATLDESDWDGDNQSPNLRDEFLNGYDVYLGRNTGGITWALRNQITEDPARSGYANPASIAQFGQNARNSWAGKSVIHPYEYRNDMILCTQLFPFYPDGKTTNLGWAFSQADTEEEPFGTASGEFYGRFINEFYGTGGATGEPIPAYVEITNEPLWDLVTLGDEDPAKIFRFHSTVAREVRKYNPGMQVGGYCAAFPDFDKDGFRRWNDRWKLFIDIAGADMDFFTIHLYDFPSIGGKKKYRKGSNLEATFDMLEQYSYMTLGEVKPIMVSEYNAQTHDYNREKWSPYRDWLKVLSTNSMVMQFMERANIMNKTIPFFMNKAEWGYDSETGLPHGSRLMRKENEPTSYTGQWVYAETAKFYQLWSDVNGTRIDSKTNNLDILCDAYVEGKKAYVIINNLEFQDIDLKMNIRGVDATPTSIEVRHCYLEGGVGGIPKLDITTESSVDEITIGAEATYILTYTYADDIVIDKSSEETKYYSDTYLRFINAQVPIQFNINGVDLGSYGEACLRIGVGRDHGKTLRPEVKVNGETVNVPTNHRGGPQTDRDNFFGVLEVPVKYELLNADNEIELSFPEAGGYVSSVTMQVYNFSHDFRNYPDAVEVENLDEIPKIYPNPTTGLLNLPKVKGSWSIYNTSGQKLFETSEYQIDISNYPKGLYLFRSGSMVQKLLLN